MMDTTTSLEDFEKWWIAPEQAELRSMLAMGWGFRIWKAARESIEVDLPAKANMDSCFDGINYANSSGRNRAIDDCSAALRSAGLTVKGD